MKYRRRLASVDRWDPKIDQVNVAWGIFDRIAEPSRFWSAKIVLCQKLQEDADILDDRTRVLDGAENLGKSTFEWTQPMWTAWIANEQSESGSQRRNRVAVEICDPCDAWIPAYMVGAHLLKHEQDWEALTPAECGIENCEFLLDLEGLLNE